MKNTIKKIVDYDYQYVSRNTHNIVAPIAAGLTALFTLGIAVSTFAGGPLGLLIGLTVAATIAGVISAVSWLKGKAPKADLDEMDQRDKNRKAAKQRSKSQEMEKEKDVELDGQNANVRSQGTQTSDLHNEESRPNTVTQHETSELDQVFKNTHLHTK